MRICAKVLCAFSGFGECTLALVLTPSFRFLYPPSGFGTQEHLFLHPCSGFVGPRNIQRRRDDNKKNCGFEGGGGGKGGQRGKSSKTVFLHGKRHNNKILKVQNLLSRIFVVIAQAPKHAQTTRLRNPHSSFRDISPLFVENEVSVFTSF